MRSLSLLAILLSFVSTVSLQAAKPNVILIMTDDQGYGDVGFHGNTMIKTPHLDRLATESVRFTNFHVDPTCSETRSALMTGRYSSRAGVWHTIMGRSILHNRETTMAQVFQSSGYRTGIFGKWHLGDNYPFRPEDRGFEEVLVCGGGGVGQTPDYWTNDYFDDTYYHNGKPEKQKGYCTDVFFAAAKTFISKNKDRPFFCYIPTNAPHGPFNVAARYSDPYVKKGVPPRMAKFYGMITNIDENVGSLLSMLKKTQLEQNTVLIFMTDNGTAAGVLRGRQAKKRQVKWRGFNAGMRGQKGSQYDGGHRVPCFVRYKGLNIPKGGREIQHLTAHFDLLPTLIDMCGLKKPKHKMDGISRKLPMQGAKVKVKGRTMVVHSQRVDQPKKYRKFAVMTDRWRLVNGQQLYDLAVDPKQRKDVAKENPQLVSRLRLFYEQWWADVSKGFNDYSRIVLGAALSHPREMTCHDWHGPRVPWHQGMVARDLRANGFWAVTIAKAGRYRITMRARPKHVPYKFQEGTATVRIAGKSATVAIKKGESSASVVLTLPAGNTRLLTTIRERQRGVRGAYFVQVVRNADATSTAANSSRRSELKFRSGDRITWVGGTNVERRQAFGYLETVLTSAYPNLNLKFRNLGWSGDDVHGLARAVFGPPANGFKRLIADLKATRPTVVMIEYGNNEAHRGEGGMVRFQQGFQRLLGEVKKLKATPVVWLPRDYETVGAPLPPPDKYNHKLTRYRDWLRRFCVANQIATMEFFVAHRARSRQTDALGRTVVAKTNNGIHLTRFGHWRTAPAAAFAVGVSPTKWSVSLRVGSGGSADPRTQLQSIEMTKSGGSFVAKDKRLPLPNVSPASVARGLLRIRGLEPGRYLVTANGRSVSKATSKQLADGVLIRRVGSAQAEKMRQAIIRKNQFVFHRYRPQNETYLFLFRKHEQGNNAKEVFQFGAHIEKLEKQIAKLARPKKIQFEIRPVK